jgi:hypothetical protein
VGEGDQVRQYQTGVRRSRASDRRWGRRVVSLRCRCLDAIGGEADVGRRHGRVDPKRLAHKRQRPKLKSRGAAVLCYPFGRKHGRDRQ